jgi:hypothetical protein
MVAQYTTALDAIPLWGVFVIVVMLVLAAIEGGYRLGRYRLHRSDTEKEAPVGAMAAATLGLLAFMLAFTFGIAASRLGPPTSARRCCPSAATRFARC